MISFSRVSRRSTLSGITLATSLLLVTLLFSGCGGSSPNAISTYVPNTVNPEAKACAVSTPDLGPGGGAKATAPDDKATGTITVDGSSAFQPLLGQAQAEYLAANKGATITVNAGDSSTSLTNVESSKVQAGASDLFASDINSTSYTDLHDTQVAVVIFALVVNPDVAPYITNLTTQQIQQIFSGQIDNWSKLGGPNETITTIERPSDSASHAVFSKYVMQGVAVNPSVALSTDDSASVGASVSSLPGAIGYVATSFIGTGGKYQGKVIPVCIDGQKPGPDQVASDAYQFWSIEHMYTKGAATGLAANFIKYILSDAFQKTDVPGLYFLPISKLSTAASQSHQA